MCGAGGHGQAGEEREDQGGLSVACGAAQTGPQVLGHLGAGRAGPKLVTL